MDTPTLEELLRSEVSCNKRKINEKSDPCKEIEVSMGKITKLITMGDKVHQSNRKHEDTNAKGNFAAMYQTLHMALCTLHCHVEGKGSQADCDSTYEEAKKAIDSYKNAILAANVMPRQQGISHDRNGYTLRTQEEVRPVGKRVESAVRTDLVGDLSAINQMAENTMERVRMLNAKLCELTEENRQLHTENAKLRKHEEEHKPSLATSQQTRLIGEGNGETDLVVSKKRAAGNTNKEELSPHLHRYVRGCLLIQGKVLEVMVLAKEIQDCEFSTRVVQGHGFHLSNFSTEALRLPIGEGFTRDRIWDALVMGLVRSTNAIAFSAVVFFYSLWSAVCRYLYSKQGADGLCPTKAFVRCFVHDDQYGNWMQYSMKILSEHFPGCDNDTTCDISEFLQAPLTNKHQFRSAYLGEYDIAHTEDRQAGDTQKGDNQSNVHSLPHLALPTEWELEATHLRQIAQSWSPVSGETTHQNFYKVVRKLASSALALCCPGEQSVSGEAAQCLPVLSLKLGYAELQSSSKRPKMIAER
jgi:regulator of replication initiation timing